MLNQMGMTRQREIYLPGFRGLRPAIPTRFSQLETLAKKHMSRHAYAYIAGGAGSGKTMVNNRQGFDAWKILPHMLRDVSTAELQVRILGQTLPAPVLTAPIGVLEMVHPEADLALARVTSSLGIPMIISNQASMSMEDCAANMGDQPRWFQLYWSKSDELVVSLLERAAACGCAAIVVTLDTTLLGWRPEDLDLAYLPFSRGLGIAQYTSDPVFRALTEAPEARQYAQAEGGFSFTQLKNYVALCRKYPYGGGFWQKFRSLMPLIGVRTFIDLYSRPSIRWEDLAFLREHTRLPLLLKGILRADDARRAVDMGVDGLIVSNHGGRQVNGAIAAIDALPGIAEAVGGQVPVLMDSGIREGSDIFKALALGARAVCIGRPYVYGLALGGEEGAKTVLRNLIADFELTMRLAGCSRVGEIHREMLMRS